MSTETIHYDQHPLIYLLPDGSSLTVQLVAFTADYVADTLDRVDITFLVTPEDYERIDAEALFNLTTDVRGPNFNLPFAADRLIEIEARLHPDYLPTLESETESVREMGAFLLHLSQSHPDHPLLNIANWYALRVKQEQPLPRELSRGGGSLKIGYSTTWIDNLGGDEQMSAPLRTLIKTLEADQWAYVREVGDTLLSMRYWNDETDDRWTIYAQIREEEQFCLVYSVSPIRFSVTQIPGVTEFIMHANSDLPIGSFELNHDKPEIRFKTSLDFEGGELTMPLVRQLLRGNVAMMERYLPGLHALLEEGVSWGDALAMAEA